MLADLWIKHRDWVLHPIRYSSVDRLIEILEPEILSDAGVAHQSAIMVIPTEFPANEEEPRRGPTAGLGKSWSLHPGYGRPQVVAVRCKWRQSSLLGDHTRAGKPASLYS